MIAKNLLTVAIVATATMTGLGVSTMLPGPSATLPVPLEIPAGPDTRLAERILHLLRRDGGMMGDQFGIAVDSGIVTLTGWLPDEHAVRRALDLVSAVPGVREVRNATVLVRSQ
jgi:hypothetical protein